MLSSYVLSEVTRPHAVNLLAGSLPMAFALAHAGGRAGRAGAVYRCTGMLVVLTLRAPAARDAVAPSPFHPGTDGADCAPEGLASRIDRARASAVRALLAVSAAVLAVATA